MANSRSGDSIIERVARILEAFDGSTLSMSVSELGRRADLPTSTAHRLVDELAATGLVERRGREVQLGLRLWELTERSSRVFALREAARPHLERLRARLGQHVFLGVLDRFEVLYVDRLVTEKSTVNITRIAARLPAHACSAGLVLVAHSAPAVQDTFLNSRFARFTPGTVTDKRELRRIMAEVRHTGFAVAAGFIVEPSSGIAVPIEGPDATVVAAVGVVTPLGEENLPGSVLVLQATAADISRSIRELWATNPRLLPA